MKVQVFPTYDALSSQGADDLISLLALDDPALVCVASGDSPSGLYRALVPRLKNNKTDISNLFFVGLDEWAGMNGDDEGSCRYHLNNQLFKPLQIEDDRIGFFDGRSNNAEEECIRIENFINHHGGIDVAILGLGINGHVGMNEPGTHPELRSHVTKIDPLTQQVGQKYFSQKQDLSQGLTLGLATLKEAKHIMLIVNGEHKASIVKQVLESEISEELPASLLRHHTSLTLYLDESAAQLISSHEQRDFRH